MATSITHEDIKPLIGVATATTTYDTEFDTICTLAGSSVDAYADSGAPANVLKQAAVYIASGGALVYLASLPGRSEAVSAGGISLGESVNAPVGDKLISLGWELLKPFNVIDFDAVTAEAAYRVALAAARDDHVVNIATAEKDKAVNEAALLASQELKVDAETLKVAAETAKITAEELKVDAEELKVDAETSKIGSEKSLIDKQILTETEAPAKVIADASMSTGYAADANARAGLNVQRLADMVAYNASLVDDTELPTSNTTDESFVFGLDAEGYL